eukprot:1473989-Pyramimonas_sp.AAC.1
MAPRAKRTRAKRAHQDPKRAPRDAKNSAPHWPHSLIATLPAGKSLENRRELPLSWGWRHVVSPTWNNMRSNDPVLGPQ